MRIKAWIARDDGDRPQYTLFLDPPIYDYDIGMWVDRRKTKATMHSKVKFKPRECSVFWITDEEPLCEPRHGDLARRKGMGKAFKNLRKAMGK